MSRLRGHAEIHRSTRAGWLRAFVLGANDAVVSTASLMVGVAAADASRHAILTAGVAGLVSGAMSMASGEYVSVSSQRDAEHADIEREKHELATAHDAELDELTGIYIRRGLTPELAREVAKQLTAHDPLEAHLRDELGLDPNALSHPFQAAWISAVSFAVFALLPIIFMLVAPIDYRIPVLMVSSLISLIFLGALGAYLGGAAIGRAVTRVATGGLLAMVISFIVGHFLGDF